MTEQLRQLLDSITDLQGGQEISFEAFLFLLLASLASSLLLGYLYLFFYSSRPTGSHIHLAFPLLAVSVTAIFVTIQFSLPLSLGLLGALSIVRFRTPVKESEEVAFIMLVIASSLACATFNLIGLGAILLVAVVALVARRWAPALLRGPAHDGSLVVSLPAEEYASKSAELFDFLDNRLRRPKVESISKSDGQVVVTLNFKAIRPAGVASFESELREIVEATHFSILYSRPGAL
jgi:hypothetical protein